MERFVRGQLVRYFGEVVLVLGVHTDSGTGNPYYSVGEYGQPTFQPSGFAWAYERSLQPVIGSLSSLLPYIRPGHVARHWGAGLFVAGTLEGGYYVTVIAQQCFYPAKGTDELFGIVGETTAEDENWTLS
jgi:hypothetical protein